MDRPVVYIYKCRCEIREQKVWHTGMYRSILSSIPYTSASESTLVGLDVGARGIMWWKFRVWKSKGFWTYMETGVCQICRKYEELYHFRT